MTNQFYQPIGAGLAMPIAGAIVQRGADGMPFRLLIYFR